MKKWSKFQSFEGQNQQGLGSNWLFRVRSKDSKLVLRLLARAMSVAGRMGCKFRWEDDGLSRTCTVSPWCCETSKGHVHHGGWKFTSGDEDVGLGHCRDIELMDLFRPRVGRH